MVKPLEFYIEKTDQKKKAGLRAIFPSYVFEMKRTKSSLCVSAVYSGIDMPQLHAVSTYVKRYLKGKASVSIKDNSLTLNITQQGPFQESKKSAFKIMEGLNLEFEYLDLEKGMRYLMAVNKDEELQEIRNQVIVDEEAIVFTKEKLRRVYKRKGHYCNEKCKALELMIAESDEEQFPEGMDEDCFEELYEEAEHYFNRSEAYLQEANTTLSPFRKIKDRILAYRDAERSLRIVRYQYRNVIEKAEPFSDVASQLIVNYSKDLCLRAYCAELLFENKGNISAARRFASRSVKELKTLCGFVEDKIKDELSEEDMDEEELEFSDYFNCQKEVSAYLDILKRREKDLKRKLKRPKQAETEFSLDEVPVFERYKFVKPGRRFEQFKWDFFLFMNKIKENEDYLGFSINSFIF